MSGVEVSPDAVGERLRRMSALSNLATNRRLDTKIDMSAAAVTRRLKAQSMLRRACLRFAARGEAAVASRTRP